MYEETVQQSETRALEAIKKIRSLSIKYHPKNFTVWYEYYSDRYKDLQNKINELEASNQVIDENLCNEIYTEFFTYEKENEKVIEVAGNTTEVIGTITKEIESVLHTSSKFDSILEKTSSRIETFQSVSELKETIAFLINKTREMNSENKKLSNIVSESFEKLTELKDKLTSSHIDAAVDNLTGLGNYKLFEKTIINECKKAQIAGSPLSLIFVDIDNFTNFNKKFGVQNGDLVLRFFAKLLVNIVGDTNFTGRVGGDEFVVILPRENLKLAKDKAEQVRKLLAERIIKNKVTNTELGNITVSIGIADYNNEPNLQNFILRAKSALTVAKNSGHNRIICQNRLHANQYE